jgi:hypothetical protein
MNINDHLFLVMNMINIFEPSIGLKLLYVKKI